MISAESKIILNEEKCAERNDGLFKLYLKLREDCIGILDTPS